MIKVSIIGSGNVAQHLISTFQNLENSSNEIELFQAFARKKESLIHLLPENKIVTNYNALGEADLYIIAVSDDAIATVSDALPFKNRLVVHTSGSMPFSILNNNNRKGVFYPLQTFTKGKAVDFTGIPICLESENGTDYKVLEKVVRAISNKVFAINSEQRKALHVAAVFVNNFTNHLFAVGNEICTENKIPFDILKPLMEETFRKLETLSPKEAQTGPAIRNDQKTIAAHEAFLKDKKQLNLYKTLTQSIQDNGKKL
ncbi:hypothetical protein B6A10_12365 [Flavobacterium sp. L1I52]|uniref:DUF2520 domain-containing protein n=1 Tax=Flavobacterium pokkalii TaxID=1940408 RepID=A0ABR7UUC7_9FLAO|nr:Rossmann-like and DUF2520 domain-containing protein [Flavobacterium pokkalii]MBD0725976.1 hypothetical protein [Flavobacterium pokkalii]